MPLSSPTVPEGHKHRVTTPEKPRKIPRRIGHGEVRVYRGTGVSRAVRRTTWDRSLKNWELQIPCFEELFLGEGTLWDSSLPVSLTLWDATALFTLPLPLPQENPAEPRRTLRETDGEPSERPPQSPLRGKFPRRASRRVVGDLGNTSPLHHVMLACCCFDTRDFRAQLIRLEVTDLFFPESLRWHVCRANFVAKYFRGLRSFLRKKLWIFWARGSAERIWGDFFFGLANFRKLAGEFWWQIFAANFSALFFLGFRPPKKFTPKIHA